MPNSHEPRAAAEPAAPEPSTTSTGDDAPLSSDLVVDHDGEDSFPASDPPAHWQGEDDRR